jgi:hypothetical protein
VSSAEADEDAGSLEFTVTLDAESSKTVEVAWATVAGTATADTDYTESSGTLTFPAGLVERTLFVPLLDDDNVRDERDAERAGQCRVRGRCDDADGDRHHRQRRRAAAAGRRAPVRTRRPRPGRCRQQRPSVVAAARRSPADGPKAGRKRTAGRCTAGRCSPTSER